MITTVKATKQYVINSTIWLLLIVLNILLGGCIEPYDFVVENNEPRLVVEGFISNVSFDQSIKYPSDGRHFSIELRFTSNVVNIRDEVVSGAQVQLMDDNGAAWPYTEIEGESAIYMMLDSTFYAENGREYKLKICLPDGDIYESDWVSMPKKGPARMGDIDFVEDEVEKYVYIGTEEEIRSVQGIHTTLNLLENTTGEPLYYRWTFDPTWIYRAPLPVRSPNAVQVCWAKNEYYLSGYELQEDFSGGYQKELFFIETVGNSRLYEGFSVLVVQQILNQDYYYFWENIKEKSSSNAIFDKQPYNLSSNIYGVNNDKQVSGYFDVVYEQAKRWYFDKDDLSYALENNLAENCIKYADPGPPAPECLNCLEYSGGNATAEKPKWWKQD